MQIFHQAFAIIEAFHLGEDSGAGASKEFASSVRLLRLTVPIEINHGGILQDGPP